MTEPRIVSLCSGCGGLDLAVEEVFGAVTVAHCEWESAPSKVLAHRWPGVPNLHDVKSADWTNVRAEIATAGYPCQPFSHAGQRKGTDDERHLWPHVAEAIRRVRPRLVVLENVAGHRSLGFGVVLGELAEDGYDAQWTSLRAADVGAPHNRERVFIVAADTRGGSFARTAATRDGLRLAAERSDRPTPDAEGTGLEGARASGCQPERPEPGCDLVAAADADRDALRKQSVTISGGSSAPVAGLPHVDASADTYRDGLQGVGRLDTIRRDVDGRGSTNTAWGQYEPAIQRWERRLGRLAPPPTETSTKGGQRLSPRFVEWMMGLPAGWVTDVPGISRNDQLKMLGNGVVPQQAAEALRRML